MDLNQSKGGEITKIQRSRIELIQANKGMSRKQIAEKANVDPRTISVIMRRGRCRPETAGKIARALGVDPKDIMEEE